MPLPLVAGPCAAESFEQLSAAVEAVRGLPGLQYVRAGVWKPRSRPGCFEGHGPQALKWIEELARREGCSFCVEVATTDHLRMARDHGVKAFWIGSRTTSDPFALQSLCDAFGPEVEVVYVKNPIAPDSRLWAGAIGRLQRGGVQRIVALHRGYYPLWPGLPTRHWPCWHTIDELRSLVPGIEVHSDPSHLAGRADRVGAMAAAALERGLQGLFIEVHPNPALALSDAHQQLTPHAAKELLERIHSHSPLLASALLEAGREAIDALDEQILSLLAERMRVAQNVACAKRTLGEPIDQPARWADVRGQIVDEGARLGLSRAFCEAFLPLLERESLDVQEGLR